MKTIKTQPLVRIRIERRRSGWLYIISDRNAVEQARSIFMPEGKECYAAAIERFKSMYPGELQDLRKIQISAPATLLTVVGA